LIETVKFGLREVNEHLFVDVASRAQIDELIEVIKDIRRASSVGAVELEKIAGSVGRSDVIARLDELQLFLQKQDAAKMLPLDALVLDFGKFQKQQANFMNAIFNGGSVSTVDDEEAARLEKIDALVRRYGISRELAEERVRGSAVYEPSTGRGMRGSA
jgi:hypothetical protein